MNNQIEIVEILHKLGLPRVIGKKICGFARNSNFDLCMAEINFRYKRVVELLAEHNKIFDESFLEDKTQKEELGGDKDHLLPFRHNGRYNKYYEMISFHLQYCLYREDYDYTRVYPLHTYLKYKIFLFCMKDRSYFA